MCDGALWRRVPMWHSLRVSMLQGSADPNVHTRPRPGASRGGWSALHTAALHGRVACARLLLSSRAELAHDAATAHGRRSPSALAHGAGHARLVALLDGAAEEAAAGEEVAAVADVEQLEEELAAVDVANEPGRLLEFCVPADAAASRDEAWMEWPVINRRSCSSLHHPCLYKVSSATPTHANLLQMICRANGLQRDPPYVGAVDDEAAGTEGCDGDSEEGGDGEEGGGASSGGARWSVCYLAGRLHASDLAALRRGLQSARVEPGAAVVGWRERP